MDGNLLQYLNDHLAGSSGAIGLIKDLASSAEVPEDAEFFLSLEKKVDADRSLLKQLIERLGESSSAVLETAGSITGAAGRLKLTWEGMDPGGLGRFEALELLSLGIQGKRLLWLALAEIAGNLPEWRGVNFADLELDAIEQRDSVEARRIEAGAAALLDIERRSGSAKVV